MIKQAQPTYTVDAKALNCPMPLLKAKLALNTCAVAETVRILATDSGSVRDFHAFAQLSAHELIHFAELIDSDGQPYYEYILQKG